MQEFTKKKALGQNFLTNDSIPKRIAEECGVDSDSAVIEIGPGMGILTNQLALRAKKVVAVELDDELIPILKDRFCDSDNVEIIHSDILKCDIGGIIKEKFASMPVYICANLPYYITTPIIMMLLEGGYGFESITVMVQKEVADRLCSSAGSTEYGAVTASVSYYGKVEKLFKVGAACFSPKPKVDSMVIKITPYKSKPVKPINEKLFFRVIKASFATRRKTLLNSLSSAFGEVPKAELERIITARFPSTVRGETLSVSEFAYISDEINKIHKSTEENQ